MNRCQWLRVAAGLVVGGLPTAGWAALAGKPGNSGTLGGNGILAQQKLICDPSAPDAGSMSVTYDPNLSQLINYEYGPGYGPRNGTIGFIGVNGFTGGQMLVPIDTYFSTTPTARPTQAGYVQIQYAFTSANGNRGRISLAPFVQLDRDAGVTAGEPNAVDTHALYFVPGSGAKAQTNVTYRIFGAGAGFFAGNTADFVSSAADGTTTATNGSENPIGSATVTGNFTPEPSSLAVAGFAVAGLLARRRGRTFQPSL